MENSAVLHTDLKKIRITPEAGIKALVFLFQTVALSVLLFVPFITRTDILLNKPVRLSGVQLLSAISEGKLLYESGGTTINLYVPLYLSLFVLFLIVLFSVSLILCLALKKGFRFSGIIAGAASGLLILFFAATMLFSGFQAGTFGGGQEAFYKLFGFSYGYTLTLFSSLFVFICGVVLKPSHFPALKKYWFMYFLLAVPMVLLAIFSFYPILLQTVLSFKDYNIMKDVFSSDWSGLDNFSKIFTDKEMLTIILNTVWISFLRLISGLLPPIILALMIYEINLKFFKNTIQTIVYIPHFFSWVIIYSIVYAFLSPDGVITAISNATGMDLLNNDKAIIPILIISAIWKELGWGTIIYLASLSSIDESLYDASAVDGVGPLRKLWYITLPELMPVIIFLTIMSIGNILKGAGGEQILLFATSPVLNKVNVIDTWVYWQGLGQNQYGLGAAVSFFQSGIGLIMVLLANKASVKAVGRGLW